MKLLQAQDFYYKKIYYQFIETLVGTDPRVAKKDTGGDWPHRWQEGNTEGDWPQGWQKGTPKGTGPKGGKEHRKGLAP